MGNEGHCEKQEELREISDIYEWAQSHLGISPRTNNSALYQLCEAVLEFKALVRDGSILREHLKALAIFVEAEKQSAWCPFISAIRQAVVICPSRTMRKCILEAGLYPFLAPVIVHVVKQTWYYWNVWQS